MKLYCDIQYVGDRLLTFQFAFHLCGGNLKGFLVIGVASFSGFMKVIDR